MYKVTVTPHSALHNKPMAETPASTSSVTEDWGEEDQPTPNQDYISGTGPATIYKQGAEARLYTSMFYGKPVIIKERFAKTYRHPDLDGRLTAERLKTELRTMVRCAQLGILVPALYFVDNEHNSFGMKYYKTAVTVREFVEEHFRAEAVPPNVHCLAVCTALGHVVATLHSHNIVHGDLTTSNVLCDNHTQLIQQSEESVSLVLIDFGLSSVCQLVEDKAVDLYVLERAFVSAHPGSECLFEAVLNAYQTAMGKAAKAVLNRLDEVRQRGRKRDMVG